MRKSYWQLIALCLILLILLGFTWNVGVPYGQAQAIAQAYGYGDTTLKTASGGGSTWARLSTYNNSNAASGHVTYNGNCTNGSLMVLLESYFLTSGTPSGDLNETGNGSSQTFTGPSITTAQANDMIVAMAWDIGDGSTSTWTTEGGYPILQPTYVNPSYCDFWSGTSGLSNTSFTPQIGANPSGGAVTKGIVIFGASFKHL